MPGPSLFNVSPRGGLSLLDTGMSGCVKTRILSLREAEGDVAIHYYQYVIGLLRFTRKDISEFSHSLVRRDDGKDDTGVFRTISRLTKAEGHN